MSPCHNRASIFLIICLATMLYSADNGNVYIGVVGGVESYPWSLRSYQWNESNAKLYPQLEIGTDVTDRLFFTGTFSYHTYHVSLFECFCTQISELTLITLDLDYTLQRGVGRFGIGTGVLVGFNVLEHGLEREHHAGLGIKVYAIAVQPLFKNIFWGLRTGVRRLHIQLYEQREAFNLDCFSVELLVYLSN